MMKSYICATPLILLGLPGCSEVIISNGLPASGTPTGVAYALPKGQVQLSWARTQASPSDLQKAQAALSTAQQSLGKDQQLLAIATANNTNDPSIPGLQNQILALQLHIE